jgi:ABC-2 type transport system permease protein
MNIKYFFSDWYYLSIRNTKQIWRPLLALIPSMFIPIFFFLVNSVSLSAMATAKGFPPNISYREFIAPVAIFTAIFFSSGNAGIELVQDISSGYLKKLLIMPINRLAIVLGKLSEIAIQALMQGSLVVVLLLAIGIRFHTGFLGIVAMFAMLILFAMAWSCVGMIFALRTQNARLVQSMFILVFPFLYITSSQSPRNLLPPGFRTIVAYNPVTYIIEGVRGLVLNDWNDPAIKLGFLAAGTLFVVMVSLVVLSFKKALK